MNDGRGSDTWNVDDAGARSSVALPPTIGGDGAPMPPSEIVAGRYRIAALLGRGGHGEVWEASDRLTGATVAVKLLAPGTGVSAARVRQEIFALRLLHLTGVVRLIDEGVEEGRAFLVMDKVQGAPFPGVAGPRSWQEIEGPALSLLGSLAAVHGAGIVHRDLKPANVLVDSSGRATILDFGLAHLTTHTEMRQARDGRLVGTPAYLAPEQLSGDRITARADLYAVGVMLYHALSGALPHHGETFVTLLRDRLDRRAEPLGAIVPSIDRRVADTIDRLLSLDPSERPASALEVRALLQRGEGARAGPTRLDAPHAFDEPALRPLFVGPDRLFHLQEDAARLLFARTGGDAGRVRDELDSWERSGLARRDGDRWIVDRSALDFMESGLLGPNRAALAQGAEQGWSNDERRRIHRELAAASPAGTPERLGHLLAGGDPDIAEDAVEVAAATCSLARELAEGGLLGRAAAVLAEGLQGARAAPPAARLTLQRLWAEVAIADATPAALDRVLHHLCREGERGSALLHVEDLLRAALAFRSSDRAVEMLERVVPFADERLERARLGLRALATRRRPLPEEEALLAEIEGWAGADRTRRAALAGLLGRLRYRQGRYDEAAALQIEAAAGEVWVTHQLNATLNAASALLEAHRLEEAMLYAERARELGRRCRHAFYEARAEWLLRAAGYRLGQLERADLPLLEAITRIGVRDLEALAHLTEAAIAYRGGDLEGARALAEHAHKLWGELDDRAGALLCRALAIASGSVAGGDEIEALASRALGCTLEGIGVQALGLLARARPKLAGTWVAAMETMAARAAPAQRSRRAEVLSVEEAVAATRADPSGH